MNQELDLFGVSQDLKAPPEGPTENPIAPKYVPLAHKARPTDISEYAGFNTLVSKYPWLKHKNFPGLVLWGPPGGGKTTLAQLLAKTGGLELYKFNAVLGGVAELKKLIQSAQEMEERYQQRALIFVDEIHRFNKAQQDALLPYVETGAFALIGATTENPRVSVNKALLSRLRVVKVDRPTTQEVEQLLERAIDRFAPHVPKILAKQVAASSGGDVRQALNAIEAAGFELEENPTLDTNILFERIRSTVLEIARDYDLGGDRHYDVISAFIKSIRGSDPDAALLWLATMLEGGEDPVFIARRLVIAASEDIGNADPSALPLAIAALQASQNIGMPEARIPLAQATSYLASTVKSNAAYKAINQAMEHVRENPAMQVPEHLKNYPSDPKRHRYIYSHDFPGHFVRQQYSPIGTPKFYRPTDQGREKALSDRLLALWGKQES